MTKTFFFLSMLLCHASGKLWTSDVENAVLDHHNKLRRGEGASNMKQMKWDPILAQAASAWADQCVFRHGQPKGIKPNFRVVGQNLYMTTGELDATKAVQTWFDEKAHYNIDSMACRKVCGHYTQVVWADSEYLGCASARCATKRLRGTIMVCNYGPGGNYLGKKPYNKGKECSECPKGYSCNDGLCHKP